MLGHSISCNEWCAKVDNKETFSFMHGRRPSLNRTPVCVTKTLSVTQPSNLGPVLISLYFWLPKCRNPWEQLEDPILLFRCENTHNALLTCHRAAEPWYQAILKLPLTRAERELLRPDQTQKQRLTGQINAIIQGDQRDLHQNSIIVSYILVLGGGYLLGEPGHELERPRRSVGGPEYLINLVS